MTRTTINMNLPLFDIYLYEFSQTFSKKEAIKSRALDEIKSDFDNIIKQTTDISEQIQSVLSGHITEECNKNAIKALEDHQIIYNKLSELKNRLRKNNSNILLSKKLDEWQESLDYFNEVLQDLNFKYIYAPNNKELQDAFKEMKEL